MRISRSKVDLFIECPHCFWLNINKKISRPSSPPFTLNVAVDHLLKNEFNLCRGHLTPERLAKENMAYMPAIHPKLEVWRENFKGVTRKFGSPEIEFFGAIDDLWIDPKTNQYIVVDYKATSKSEEVNLDADWQISYKRQVEFYQWLLRGNDLNVSNDAWFVYANGIKDDAPFLDKLSFKTKLIKYVGSDSWVEPTLIKLIECLSNDSPPEPNLDCKFCKYLSSRTVS